MDLAYPQIAHNTYSIYTSYSVLHLCLHSQQDAQEFLIYLLEGLHEDLNRSDKKKSHMILPKEQEEEEDRLRYGIPAYSS